MAQWQSRYVKFRGGPGFIWTLTAFLVVFNVVVFSLWMTGVSWWPWLLLFAEAPFLFLNLLLSIEASYAMPVLLMEQEKKSAELLAKQEEFKLEVLALLREGRASDRQLAEQVRAVLEELAQLEEAVEDT